MSIDRIRKLVEIIRNKKLNYILVTDNINVEYISGFRSSNVFLLVSTRKNILFTDFRYKFAAERFVGKYSLWEFHEIKENNFTFLKKYLRKGSRVGIESNVITLDKYREMKKKLKGIKLIQLGDEVSDVSIVKEKKEIGKLQFAAEIGDKAYNIFLKKIKTGMTELQAADLLMNLCKEYGSEKPSFETIVLFGNRTALPHGRPSNKKLKMGEWILCDFGCVVEGFCSDMTRTVIMGKANKMQKKIYGIVLKAWEKACKAVCAGVKGKDVDRCARKVIEDSGYGEAFGHGTGHGIGLRIHEKPRVRKKNETLLSENMVMTIEPGIYLKKTGGVRIEDMLVVKETGSYYLTKTNRSLIEIKN